MIKGIFLYYPEAAYLEETRAALSDLNTLDIEREIEASLGIVSNLIPRTLQRGAESWLVLFHSDYRQELLILPVSFENGNFRNILMNLIPLLESYFTSDPPRIPARWIGRFQYLRVDDSLDSIINPDINPEPRPQQEGQEIRQSVLLFQETSQYIQRRREDKLNEVQRKKDFGVLDGLDDVFVSENAKLFIEIRHRGFQEVVPSIVYDFWDIMDSETMRFLISSETVWKFAEKHSFPSFDYSAPGCGLWKAVERELNLSLVLHLRREVGIVESVSIPWKRSQHVAENFPILTGVNQSVNLSERESKQSQNLKGIMLGPMKHMLGWGHCNTVREKLEHFLSLGEIQHFLGQCACKSPVPECLDKVRTLRNGHAHISAMAEGEFRQLRNLVLPSTRKPRTCLVEILQLKRRILRYWESKGDRFTKSKVSVTTEAGQTVDLSLCNRVMVKPTENETTKLIAKDENDTPYIIAVFDKIEDANAAFASLTKAAEAGESWSAREFKRNRTYVNRR